MSANEHTREVEPDRRTPAFVAPDRRIYRGTGRPIQDIRVVDLLPPRRRGGTLAVLRRTTRGRTRAGR